MSASPSGTRLLLLLLALAVCRLGSVASGLGVLLSFSGVLLTLRMVILAVLLERFVISLMRGQAESV